jgi:Fic family protein
MSATTTMKYIHQREKWPGFYWDTALIQPLLSYVRYQLGKILGRVECWGVTILEEGSMEAIISDVITSSEIEGETLPMDQVRSSVARKLGLETGGLVAVNRDVDGIVEMMLDATQNYEKGLSHERFHAWQASLFPTGRSGLQAIQVGHYREHEEDSPMQVVSGRFGRPKVHFQAPAADRVLNEMDVLLDYVNNNDVHDSVLKAAIAHLWFLTIHPFDDGNGRIARALTDLLLSRSDNSQYRFYSTSAAILRMKKYYYTVLERTQKDDLEITDWLVWFLNTLKTAFADSEEILNRTFLKASFWQKHTATMFNKRQHKMLNHLLDGFTGNLTSSKWAKMTKVSQDTAARDIKDLIDKEVLRLADSGGRSTYYLLVALKKVN